MGQPARGLLRPRHRPRRPQSKFPGWVIAVIVAGTPRRAGLLRRRDRVRCSAASDDRRPHAAACGRHAEDRSRRLRSPPRRCRSSRPGRRRPTRPTPGGATRRSTSDLDDEWLHIAKITHDGSSNFMVDTLDDGGRRPGQRWSTRSATTTASGCSTSAPWEPPKSLKIRADGRWTVTVRWPTRHPKWTGKASGRNDTILRVDPEGPRVRGCASPTSGRDNTTVICTGDAPTCW